MSIERSLDLDWKKVDKNHFNLLKSHEKLKRIRHSSSHILAETMQMLKKNIKFATGPATKNGFFYDFIIDGSIDEKELLLIERSMMKHCKAEQNFYRATCSIEQAREYFQGNDQTHKLQILKNIQDQTITLYKNGNFIDLCAGPHVPNTRHCKYFKLLTATSAHWRDEKHPSLTRITGTAWNSSEDLLQYLKLMKEIKKRDHRILGPQMNLFFFHELAAAPFWCPRGVTLRNIIMEYWRTYLLKNKYEEILNPILYKKELFEMSGHWEHFKEEMFLIKDKESRPRFILKPMNCPDTMLYFKRTTRTYKELPLRIAEAQVLHRDEPTGSLHGIMRTRNLTQDDGHIFLTEEQIMVEMNSLMQTIKETYTLFNLRFSVNLSTRPAKYMGDLSLWNKAEARLKQALNEMKQPFKIDEGEGAFYGPKIDITVHDCLGREWQCGTIQLDFQLGERFQLKYTDKDGSEKQPIIIHRAIVGSFDRFLGILIEHFGGVFPTWLAPIQVAILPVSRLQDSYSQKLLLQLEKYKIRSLMMKEGTLNSRIRDALSLQKIPNLLILGEKEESTGTISLRKIQKTTQVQYQVEDFFTLLRKNIENKILDISIDDPSKFLRSGDLESTHEQKY